MSQFDRPESDPHEESRQDNRATMIRSNVVMLLFGIMILFYLVAIDHREWFSLRPASVGAVALSQASDRSRSGDNSGDNLAQKAGDSRGGRASSTTAAASQFQAATGRLDVVR